MRRFLAADPLMMCDDCRQQRRDGNFLFQAFPVHVGAMLTVAVAAAWPAAVLTWAWRWLRGKPIWHRCDRASDRAAATT